MINTKQMILIAAVFVILGMAVTAQADVFNVTNIDEFQLALSIAAFNGEHDTINVQAGLYDLSTSPIDSFLYFPASSENFSLTIQGEGASATIIENGSPNLYINTSGIFDTQANITIRGITFQYASYSPVGAGGAGLRVQTTSADITVEDSKFANNSTLGDGAGAYLRSEDGLITLTNNGFIDNSAGYDGGALWARSDGGILTLTNNTFFFNMSGIYGAGFYAWSDDGTIQITNNNFHGNSAEWSGGGCYAHSSYGSIVVEMTTFSGNSAASSYAGYEGGGGLCAISLNGTVSVLNSTFSDNSAGDGGGAYARAETVTINNNIFAGNYASGEGHYPGYGGGILATSMLGTIQVTNNAFSDNAAHEGGGGAGVWSEAGATITLRNNTFSDNSADGSGGGAEVWSETGGTITLTNNIFAGNSVTADAFGRGGGANVWCGIGGIIILTNNTVTNNSATASIFGASGGGVKLDLYSTSGDAEAYVYNNIIWGNTAGGANDLHVQDGIAGPGGTPPYPAPVYLFNNDYSDFHILWGDNLYEGGNIDADPLLTPNFHLQEGSPCIDTGNNTAPALPLTDFEGEPRVIDGNLDGTATVDMGADEAYPFILTIPRVIVKNLSHQLPWFSAMYNGILDKGTMNFWFQEPYDQMPRFWGSRSYESVVGPGEEVNFSFDWPPSNIQPSNDAIIYWSFEMVIKVINGGLTEEFPVYAFPEGIQAPDQPPQAPVLELKGRRGLTDPYSLFGFASEGTLVGRAGFKVTYPTAVEIPVYVDIKPGSCPNPLNVKSKGVLPVAVLGTEEFDVATIDPATIRLSRESFEQRVSPIRWSYEDVATPFQGGVCDRHDLDGDGYLDLTLKFSLQELVRTLELDEVAGQTIPLILTGNLKEEQDGTTIKGQDCVSILKKGGGKGKGKK